MVRVKRGNVARKHRNKILKFAKGFKGAHSRLFRTANGQVMKALVYAYVGRKRRKRDFRSLWICRVNALSREYGLTYSVAVQKENFFGVQFHPEKSSSAGSQLLKNFLEL